MLSTDKQLFLWLQCCLLLRMFRSDLCQTMIAAVSLHLLLCAAANGWCAAFDAKVMLYALSKARTANIGGMRQALLRMTVTRQSGYPKGRRVWCTEGAMAAPLGKLRYKVHHDM